MSFKTKIRRWLGITEIQEDITMLAGGIRSIEHSISKFKGELIIHSQGMGIILGKLEPILGISEDDPKRQAELKILGDKIINRLRADDMARRHTTGEL